MVVPIYFEIESYEDLQKLRSKLVKIDYEFYTSPVLEDLSLDEVEEQMAAAED
jgi:hypothetical protein